MTQRHRAGQARGTCWLVPEVHPGNWWLWWAASFVADVRIRTLHQMCVRWPRGRLRVIDLADHLSIDDTHRFRSSVVRAWEPCAMAVAADTWTVRHHGRSLAFTNKARQDLARYFERLILLHTLKQQLIACGSQPRLVASVPLRYVARLWGRAESADAGWLSRVNLFCDALWWRMAGIAFGARVAAWALRGVMLRTADRRTGPTDSPRIFYDCDNTNELSADPARRSCTWLVDGRTIRARDVLLLLPTGTPAPLAASISRQGFLAMTLAEAYRRVPIRLLGGVLRDLASLVLRPCLRPQARFESLLMATYLAKVTELVPLVESWQPRWYVESMSALGQENPALVFLEASGTTTLMYCMGAGSPFGCEPQAEHDFRSVLFAHVVASVLVVWHQRYQQFFASHPQDGLTIRVCGPLMPGDESVVLKARGALQRAAAVKWSDDDRTVDSVVAFDVGTGHRDILLRNRSSSELQTFPDPYTERYNLEFLRAMCRLLEEDARVRLIYKPRRNPANAKFFYSDAFYALLRRIERHPRGCVIDEAVNPWVPIALADICIAPPFSSVGMAALHHGRQTIYYDPMGCVQTHCCQELEPYLVTGDDALRRRIALIRHSRPPALSSTAAPCIGPEPGTNSSQRFRQWLQGADGPRVGHEPALAETHH